ncbi:hypothetical protein TcWFU_001458 [Taenia crassiceps]|uniref:SANT domain-containing protein n=1 Tax=Taenia crassiceps TaxID=6207 RepID=A0ABR4Q596_9CEST
MRLVIPSVAFRAAASSQRLPFCPLSFKAKPPIGPEYQTSIGDAASAPSLDFMQEHFYREWKVWGPEHTSLSRDVDAFLRKVKDDRFSLEGALVLLFLHNYNIQHTSDDPPNFVPLPKKDRNLSATTILSIGNGEVEESSAEEMEEDASLSRRVKVPNEISRAWSEEELASFVKSLLAHGKDFEAIARDLGTKSDSFIRDSYNTYAGRYDFDTLVGRREEFKQVGGSVVEHAEGATEASSTPEPVTVPLAEAAVGATTSTALPVNTLESMLGSPEDALSPFCDVDSDTNDSTKATWASTTHRLNTSNESDDDKGNWRLQNTVLDGAEVEGVQMKGRPNSETELPGKHMPSAVLMRATAMVPYECRQCEESCVHEKVALVAGVAAEGEGTVEGERRDEDSDETRVRIRGLRIGSCTVHRHRSDAPSHDEQLVKAPPRLSPSA